MRTVRRICAVVGIAALIVGFMIVAGTIEAWCFDALPRGIMLILGGVAGMEIGEIFE